MLKDDFFADDIEVAPVEYRGKTFYVRTLDGKARNKLFAFNDNKTPPNDCMIWAVIYGACDEQGKNLFTDQDFERLQSSNQAKLDALCLAIMKLNKLGDQDIEQKKTT